MGRPNLLIAGLNPVCTDAVSTAVMGYDPRAVRGQTPFPGCDNTMLLAEAHGVGSADLSRIDVCGDFRSRERGIRLNRRRRPASGPAAVEVLRSPKPQEMSTTENKESARVLIVDDEDDQRNGLAGLVSSWGHQVRTARDGQDALERWPISPRT
jgi:hypothetical protein